MIYWTKVAMVLKWKPFLSISKKYKEEDTIIIHEEKTKYTWF